MAIEIERRFLIKNNNWEEFITHKSNLIQGYLLTNSEDWIIRIRSEDDRFKLTLKKYILHSSNYEFEYEIPSKDGEFILSSLQNKVVKERFYLFVNERQWTIDRFKENNYPLEIAEIELQHKNEVIQLPSFLSKEITGIQKFSNYQLSNSPFSEWEKKT